MSKLGTYAELSAVLHAMKEDIGLGNNTSAEKKYTFSCCSIAK